MRNSIAVCISIVALGAACSATPAPFNWAKYQSPDWRKYQAQAVDNEGRQSAPYNSSKRADAGRVVFENLKMESDQSLAQRLLGAVGMRIAYIDRHRDRWRYYQGDESPAESIDLYTHPYALGSQYGLCGVEKYSIDFDDGGQIAGVSVSQRYGVEGPIFQKSSFDWDLYRGAMCKSVSASHAPSYFPAFDSLVAQDVAMLLVPAIDLAASPDPLPFRLDCHMYDGGACRGDVRKYLGALRLHEIDDFSHANCPLPGGEKQVCFTIKVGEGQLGPFPKYITVKGSTYMNNVRVDSVEIDEGFTIS